MTITSTTRRNQYTANGILDTFPCNFEIFADGDLDVYVDTMSSYIHHIVQGLAITAEELFCLEVLRQTTQSGSNPGNR